MSKTNRGNNSEGTSEQFSLFKIENLRARTVFGEIMRNHRTFTAKSDWRKNERVGVRCRRNRRWTTVQLNEENVQIAVFA